MSEKKKSGKFFTTIIIGGALGSLVAWLFGSKCRREKITEEIQKKKGWFKFFVLGFLFAVAFSSLWPFVAAAEPGEVIKKEKKMNLIYNAQNQEGNLDLKKIVAENLGKPKECEQDLVICQIKEVSFDLTMSKSWTKLEIPKLSNIEFAVAAPQIKNPIDQLTKPEVVILQEALARRGLLRNKDNTPVKDRGFFGSLTWLGVLRLAHIKGLDPKVPEFYKQLTEKVNGLLDKMSKDTDYVTDHPLPEHQEPGAGDKLYSAWREHTYLRDLAAEGSKKVNPGTVSVEGKSDVNIDGFVNVERISK